jgi:hypothetical protein
MTYSIVYSIEATRHLYITVYFFTIIVLGIQYPFLVFSAVKDRVTSGQLQRQDSILQNNALTM